MYTSHEFTSHDPFDSLAEQAELHLTADIPQAASDLVSELERSKITPKQEQSAYIFEKDALLNYPRIVREYCELMGVYPEKTTIVLGKGQRNIYPDIAVTLEFPGTLIELSLPTNAALEQSYVVRFVGEPEKPTYECTPAEMGNLLLSAAISYSNAEDITLARLNGDTVLSINPRDPQIYALLRKNLLEDRADDFSHEQTYMITLDEDEDAPTDLTLNVAAYHSGARRYGLMSTTNFIEDDLRQRAKITALFEITDEGGINRADIEGKRTENDVPFSLDRAISIAMMNATLETAQRELRNNPLAKTPHSQNRSR